MRKSLLSMLCVIFAAGISSTYAQNQVTNNSFESGTDSVASDWTVVSGKVKRMTSVTFTVGGQPQTQNAPNGTYFMELAADTFRDGGGNLRANAGVLGIKAPLTNRPQRLEFSAIYVPAINLDRFGFVMQFTKWNTATGQSDVISTLPLASNPGQTFYPWTTLSAQLSYQSADVPDSVTIILYSNYQQASIGLNSRFYIDNIKFMHFMDVNDGDGLGINEVTIFPNPMKDNATINYSITENARVNLSVMDMQGREVAVLVNENKIAGQHQAKLNRNNLKSGMYFYRLQAGNKVETGKFIIAE